MTTKPSFKAMFKWIEFSNAAANVLVNTKKIDTMSKLAKITAIRTSKLAKVLRSPGGGAGADTYVPEGAEHNIVITVAVVNNTLCVSYTIKCADILAPDSLQCKRYEQQ